MRTPRRTALRALTVPLIAILAVAALLATGGSSALASAPGAHAKPALSTRATGTTVVTTRKNSLGTFLVGPNGHTLYLWAADSKNKSTCSGACAGVWPPLMLKGKVKGTGGVKSSLLGSIARKGGRQVTYAGHPLYYYAADTKAGQTTGQDSGSFGAPWYAVSTSGSAITKG